MSDTPSASPRVLSVDAYRGFVMLLMMDSALRIGDMARNHFPSDDIWATLAFHTDHVPWTGCSLHDLIQPSFSFLVGVALPYSIASREERGQGYFAMLFHAVWRAALLVFLGIFLRSIGREQTNWTFMDTLTQIGMGYVFLFLVGYTRSQLVAWITFVLIVVGYWAAFAFYPLPAADFDYGAVNVHTVEPYRFKGLMEHWNKNANLAADFDVWFLNELPRKERFTHEPSGYTTLNFIPTLATMILGLIAGIWLRKDWHQGTKFLAFVIAGAAGVGLGLASEHFEICPIVKIIWTPAWVLYSGGWAFLLLAVFYLVIDIIGFWHWAFPLFVIGANSILAYVLYHTLRPFILGSYKTHLGADIFSRLAEYIDPMWEPMLTGAIVLLTLWLILFWLYRNKLFVRI